MLDLKISDQNEILIFNQPSGSKILFYYSTPTTKEKLKYNSEVVQALTEKRSADDVQEVSIKWALNKITGFRKGDLGYDDKPISSDRNDKEFFEGWKGTLAEYYGDILLAFSKTIFGEPSFVIKNDKGAVQDFFGGNSNNTRTDGQKKKKNTIKA